ncbi:MAG: DUF456 domain-containing protein [Steroidobacteraceae bacterium]|nr:DUF456 domain-containing protein [Steroidobacteraceae bacterium]
MDPIALSPVLLWALGIGLIVIGVVGTLLPALPGVVAIFGGVFLIAWIDGFERIGVWTLVVLAVLTALAFVVDIIAAMLGAKRVGASRLALVGAALGTLFGLPFGFLGLVAGPFIGAVIGEFVTRQRLDDAARVGFGTWIGLLIGTLAKLALAFTMVGIAVAAYLIA